MGFSIVNVIDPVTSSQVSIIAEFQYLLAVFSSWPSTVTT